MHQLAICEFETYCKEQLNLSVHSLRAYRQDLNAFSQFCSKQTIQCQPTSEHIISFQMELRDVCQASPATIRRRLITLRSYYAWLAEQDASCVSPFHGLRLDMRVPKRLPRPLDRPTLGAVFRSSKHITQIDPEAAEIQKDEISSQKVTGLVARLLIVTGLRVSEAMSIKVADVTGCATKIRVWGKGNRERTVYVTNERLHMDLRHYWEKRRDEVGMGAWLFQNSRGNKLTSQAFRKRLRTLSKNLNIEPHMTPHRFRHSAATLLIEEGVDIRLVQRLLGHASIATTELYTKVSDNSLVAAIAQADTLAQVDCR